MSTENFIDRRLQEKLHRIAYHLLRDDMDAEDAVQDAICNLWSSRIPATSEEAQFRLFTILRNICLNKIKRKRHFVDISECEKTTDNSDLDETDRIKTIMLASLPPLQKKIFQMSTFDDLEYSVIAERLNMNVDAVKMNMSRARKKLRELYKKSDMETTENLTFQEIEQLCHAYMACQLSKQQEKELELVLLCSDHTSPIIAEVRALMGVSTLMAITNTQSNVIKKTKPQIFKYSGIAACIATLVLCSVYLFKSTNSTEITGDVYVCVDGKVLTGHTAQIVVDDTEQQTMDMFRTIIEDVENEQRLSEQYMNSIIE